MSIPRFWFHRKIEQLIYFDEQERDHAIRVLRLGKGDMIRGFDGKGGEWLAKIVDIRRKEFVAEILEPVPKNYIEPSVVLDVYVSIPKKERWDFLLEKLTELGVMGIIPVIFERTVRVPREKKERWFRKILQAVKQSERIFIPTIEEPMLFDDALNFVLDLEYKVKIFGDTGGKIFLSDLKITEGDRISFFIGPEGDFTEREIKKLKETGFIGISLGKRILRVETAAIVGAGFLLYRF